MFSRGRAQPKSFIPMLTAINKKWVDHWKNAPNDHILKSDNLVARNVEMTNGKPYIKTKTTKTE